MKQKTENSRKCDNMLCLILQPHRQFITNGYSILSQLLTFDRSEGDECETGRKIYNFHVFQLLYHHRRIAGVAWGAAAPPKVGSFYSVGIFGCESEIFITYMYEKRTHYLWKNVLLFSVNG